MHYKFPNAYIYATVFGAFTYQTLDAIDGKQARRTGAASPLGQLFDHGCDAVVTCITGFSFPIMLTLGNQPSPSNNFRPNNIVVYLFAVTMFGSFWFANWEEYHTGILRCS